MEITPQPFISLSPLRDSAGRPILLLHTYKLPPQTTSPATVAATLRPLLSALPPEGPLTLVLCHGGLAEVPTTRAGVRAVRTMFENDQVVPTQFRARIELIVALHVSFSTRAQIYVSSFSMPGREYSKLQYCDLLADLERLLGVDSTLLGLERVDFDYDEQMRYWVGRQHEHHPVKAPNPSESLIDLNSVSLDWNNDAPVQQNENHDTTVAQP